LVGPRAPRRVADSPRRGDGTRGARFRRNGWGRFRLLSGAEGRLSASGCRAPERLEHADVRGNPVSRSIISAVAGHTCQLVNVRHVRSNYHCEANARWTSSYQRTDRVIRRTRTLCLQRRARRPQTWTSTTQPVSDRISACWLPAFTY